MNEYAKVKIRITVLFLLKYKYLMKYFILIFGCLIHN